MNDEDEVARVVLRAAFGIHSEIGPGLLESAYEAILAHVLEEQGLPVRRQVAVPIRYRNTLVDEGFRIDLLVAERLSSNSNRSIV